MKWSVGKKNALSLSLLLKAVAVPDGFLTGSRSDFWKRQDSDPDPDPNKFSAKFLLTIFFRNYALKS
jgi:hypothetical protein